MCGNVRLILSSYLPPSLSVLGLLGLGVPGPPGPAGPSNDFTSAPWPLAVLWSGQHHILLLAHFEH